MKCENPNCNNEAIAQIWDKEVCTNCFKGLLMAKVLTLTNGEARTNNNFRAREIKRLQAKIDNSNEGIAP